MVFTRPERETIKELVTATKGTHPDLTERVEKAFSSEQERGKKIEPRSDEKAPKWKQADLLKKNLDFVRKKYLEDIKQKSFTNDRVSALVTSLIDAASFRIGNEESATRLSLEDRTFGISNIPLWVTDENNNRTDIVKISPDGKEISFDYIGKKKIRQQKRIDNPDIINVLKKQLAFSKDNPCGTEATPRLFCYEPSEIEGISSIAITDQDVRKYIQNIVGVGGKTLKEQGTGQPHRFRIIKAEEILKKGVVNGKDYSQIMKEIVCTLGHYRTKKGELVLDIKGTTAEKSYIHPKYRQLYGFGRLGRNPTYHKIKQIEPELKTRKAIIDRIRIMDGSNKNDEQIQALFIDNPPILIQDTDTCEDIIQDIL